MNNKFLLLAFASVFLISVVIGSQWIVAIAALRTVGVSKGDWAEYSVTFSGNATMPEMNITWAKITVQEISGTNITFEIRGLYANGTEETETYVLDVDTGQGNGTGWFIAANLNEDDLVYTSPDPYSPYYGATINETIYRTYLGGSVQVNHLNITVSYGDPEMGWMYIMSTNYYWFKATGMVAEMSLYQLSQMGGNATWWEIEMVITAMIPEFPPALILPLFMIATLTAVWLGKKIWSTKKSIKKPSPCA